MTAPAGGRRPDRPSAGSGFRPRFFLDGPALGLDRRDLAEGRLHGKELTLSSDDARHARTVLRARPGDSAEVVLEPWRQLVPARFASLQPSVTVRLLPAPTADPAEGAERPAERLAVALVQGIPQPASFDLVVEKGTEVGVDVFVLVSAEGSPPIPADRLDGRVRRWHRIASEAAKQSKQLARPRLTVASSLADAASTAVGQLSEHLGWAGGPPVHHIVLDPSAAGTLDVAIADVARCEAGPGSVGPYGVVLWVGPEAGWSEEEISRFEAGGLRRARLGRRILKAETAGPVAAALVRFALRDW